MNIFYLDRNPKKAAHMHCDKHVVKMVLEYAQILSTAHRVIDGGDEYTHRYGKVHKASTKDWLFHAPKYIPYKRFMALHTPPPQCMPDPYKCNPDSASIDDTVSAYRAYYRGEKAHFAKWTNRSEPAWFDMYGEVA
jgi:hypothetical protein